jgi:hypothetical protein
MVSFRLYNLSDPLLKETHWSRVCYLELINSRNAAVAQGKYQLHSWGGDGQIIIPDTVTTGHYTLRAYTRWMRNDPPSAYFHLPLAIVNPRKITSADLSAGRQRTRINGGEAPGPLAGIACSHGQNQLREKGKGDRTDPSGKRGFLTGWLLHLRHEKRNALDEAYPYTSCTCQLRIRSG